MARLRCVHRYPFVNPNEGTVLMIVIGADTHNASHTLGVLDSATGRVITGSVR